MNNERYPCYMGDESQAIVDRCDALSAQDRARILGGNAQQLFGMH
jgi:hypothetical protein